MLIILIPLILIIVCIVCAFIMKAIDGFSDYEYWYIPVLILAIVLVIEIPICVKAQVCKDLTEEKYLMRYEILQEQLSDEFYKTEYLDQRQKLMADILKYNNEVMDGRFHSKTLWLNWFYPEDWDSIPLIEFPKEDKTE